MGKEQQPLRRADAIVRDIFRVLPDIDRIVRTREYAEDGTPLEPAYYVGTGGTRIDSELYPILVYREMQAIPGMEKIGVVASFHYLESLSGLKGTTVFSRRQTRPISTSRGLVLLQA